MTVLEWCALVERTPTHKLGQAYSKAYAIVVREHATEWKAQQAQVNAIAAKRAAVMARKEAKNKPRDIWFVDFTPEDTQPIPPHHGLYLVPKKYRDVADDVLKEGA